MTQMLLNNYFLNDFAEFDRFLNKADNLYPSPALERESSGGRLPTKMR
jgi:hypothetical protein